MTQFVFNNSQLSMEPFVNKIYKLEKTENFNEFLKEMGSKDMQDLWLT